MYVCTWKIFIYRERGKGALMYLKGIFNTGCQHGLYIPVHHLASILILVVVINMIEINFVMYL